MPTPPDVPTLILICGMPGAGKTTLAKQLETEIGAIRFCPDEWIKPLLADENDREERDRLRDPVELLQWQTAQRLLAGGARVIMENGFWSREERDRHLATARALGARVELHFLDVPKDEIWRRLERRNGASDPSSFAITREELDAWWPWFTPPDAQELA